MKDFLKTFFIFSTAIFLFLGPFFGLMLIHEYLSPYLNDTGRMAAAVAWGGLALAFWFSLVKLYGLQRFL